MGNSLKGIKGILMGCECLSGGWTECWNKTMKERILENEFEYFNRSDGITLKRNNM